MKKPYALFLIFFLIITTAITASTPLVLASEPHPKYASTTLRLIDHHEYIRQNPAPDYWRLTGYYVPQHNPKACGVASVTMILNALRASHKLTSSDDLFTHEKILSVSKKLGSAVGKFGKGISLDDLKTELELLASKLPLNNAYKVSTHRFNDSNESDALTQLENLLKQNETSGDNFLIANFLQSELTGDPEGAIGHHAPIAAYDDKSKMVLIFDPDRTYYEPYWVKTKTLLKAINTPDSSNKKSRGLLFIEKR